VKHITIILTIFLFLTSCNLSTRTNDQGNKIDTTNTESLANMNELPKRISFENILKIIDHSSSSTWVNKQNSNFSLALHFQEKDTLAFSYSPECWLIFPYKFDKNKLTVYWDINIDTKYDFDIVKAMKKVDKKFIGKPFMSLELLNDTTLSATYLIKEIRDEINSSSKQQVYFPNNFTLVQEGEMYD